MDYFDVFISSLDKDSRLYRTNTFNGGTILIFMELGYLFFIHFYE